MPQPAVDVAAGIYCRLSKAVMDDTTNVDDQETRGRKVADNRGWRVAAVYKDNSRSAWQRTRKRPGWDQMLADIEAGTINAIIFYHGDRLIRQPFDLELLLNLARDRGILLASPTGARDLSNPDDQFILRIEAAQACRSSDDTSRRVKRHLDRRRADGYLRTGGAGGRTFGFATDAVTHIPAEADAIREAARRVLAGEPAAAIARDLTGRGITGTKGQPLNYQRLAMILCRPQNAGLMPGGQSKAKWEPILDRDTWEDVCAILTTKGATYGRTTQGRRFLLSGLINCDTCKKSMTAWYVKGSTHVYKCVNPGCQRKMSRSQPYLDAHVRGLTVSLLNSNKVTEKMPDPVEDKALERQIIARRTQLEEIYEVLGTLQDHPGASARALTRSAAALEHQIEELQRQASSPRQRTLTRYAGITVEEFKSLPLAIQRQIIRSVYQITVLPVSRKGSGFRADDVDVRQRED